MMKKPPKNKKRRRSKAGTSNVPQNWCEDIFSGFGATRGRSGLWLFIAIFMVGFTGNNLANAAIKQSILNLRVANTVHLSDHPIWFVFVVSVNILLFLLCAGYIWCFVKRRVQSK